MPTARPNPWLARLARPSLSGNPLTFWARVSAPFRTGFTTGNAATGTFALQYAADQGAAGNYQPATWYTSSETQAHAVSVLTPGQIIRLDVTPAPPEVLTPRYVRLICYPPAGENFSAGTVSAAFMTMARDDQANRQAASNYTVA
jgi:hypothetical protein